MLKFSKKFLPFERAILEAVHGALPAAPAQLLRDQVACMNKVQRLLEWNEIELYCMHWFKVHWPEHLRFTNREEIKLATVTITTESASQEITVWAVAGRLFSLESTLPMKPLRRSKDIGIQRCEVTPEAIGLAI
jgi:hypothetical protein